MFNKNCKIAGNPICRPRNWLQLLKQLARAMGLQLYRKWRQISFSWTDVKFLKLVTEEKFIVFYKSSYKDVFRRCGNKRKQLWNLEDIEVRKANSGKNDLNLIKNNVLKDLIKRKLIPSMYATF